MQCIGRLAWDTWDTDSGDRETRDLLVTLEKVFIVPHAVTKRDDLRKQRMRDIQQGDQDKMAKIAAIERELNELEGLDEVTSTWFSKSIPLNRPYILSYAEHPSGSGGFGLTGERYGEKTFSWDWFNPKDDNRAIKLQESGEIRFESKLTPCGAEIVYMKFETDVSLRILPFAAISMKPKWRINIHAGSEIYWPSLVNGELSPNGFVEA